MPVEDDLVRLARAHQQQLLMIRAASSATVAALWDRYLLRPDDVSRDRWLPAAAQAVTAAQQAAAAAVIAHVPQSVRVAGATPDPTPATLQPAAFLSPRGVDTATVLARSVIQVRRGLADGKPFEAAMSEGRSRAVQTAATEPMLTARQANREAMKAQPRIVAYRRVPDGNACKFCLLVSTRRYWVADLMPVHPGCGCTVAPIIGDIDPGEVLDRGLADQLVAADPSLGLRGEARNTARAAAKRQLDRANELVDVHDHGELGPTLYQSGLRFSEA